MSARLRLQAGALLALSFAATLALNPWSNERFTDVPLYRDWAAAFLDGSLPYRDIAFEYPPLAAPLIALPGFAGTGPDAYRLAFALLMLAACGAAVVLAARLARLTGGDERRAALCLAALPLLTGAMVRTHFDAFAVALTLAALAAILERRPALGFALLGTGAMTKLFPLAVAPVALAWLLSRGERTAAARGAMSLAATLAVLAGAAAALSPQGALDSLRYQAERPVQVESAPAGVLHAVGALGGERAVTVGSHRSDGLVHSADGLAVAAFTALAAAAVALFALLTTRGGGDSAADRRRFVLAALGALAACVAFGKVLSPQFLVWLGPLAALGFAWGRPALGVAAAGAIALTLVEFPSRYLDVVAREPGALVLVQARNALMAAAVALAAAALVSRRSPAAARSSSPVLPRLRSGPR